MQPQSRSGNPDTDTDSTNDGLDNMNNFNINSINPTTVLSNLNMSDGNSQNVNMNELNLNILQTMNNMSNVHGQNNNDAQQQIWQTLQQKHNKSLQQTQQHGQNQPGMSSGMGMF